MTRPTEFWPGQYQCSPTINPHAPKPWRHRDSEASRVFYNCLSEVVDEVARRLGAERRAAERARPDPVAAMEEAG